MIHCTSRLVSSPTLSRPINFFKTQLIFFVLNKFYFKFSVCTQSPSINYAFILFYTKVNLINFSSHSMTSQSRVSFSRLAKFAKSHKYNFQYPRPDLSTRHKLSSYRLRHPPPLPVQTRLKYFHPLIERSNLQVITCLSKAAAISV